MGLNEIQVKCKNSWKAFRIFFSPPQALNGILLDFLQHGLSSCLRNSGEGLATPPWPPRGPTDKSLAQNPSHSELRYAPGSGNDVNGDPVEGHALDLPVAHM